MFLSKGKILYVLLRDKTTMVQPKIPKTPRVSDYKRQSVFIYCKYARRGVLNISLTLDDVNVVLGNTICSTFHFVDV